MKKKFIIGLVAAVTLSASIGLAGCSMFGSGKNYTGSNSTASSSSSNKGKYNYSETYQGTVSKQEYTTEKKAVEGFLSEELSGTTSNVKVTYVDHKVEKTLSSKEVDDLKLDKKPDSAELVKVTYTESGTSSSADLYASVKLYKNVYLLKYGNAYKYYTPAIGTGEVLTASYLEDVFDSKKYTNFTSNAKSRTEMTMNMSYDGKKADGTYIADTTETVELSETAIHLKIKATVTAKGTFADITNGGSAEVEDVELYVIKTTTGKFVTVEKYNNKFEYGGIVSNVELSDYVSQYLWSTFTTYADHTYFEKTKTGFKLRDEMQGQFMKNYTGGIAGDLGAMGVSLVPKKCDCSFGVSNGAIVNYNVALDASVSAKESGVSISETVKASGDCNFSKIGSTKVTIPSEVSKILTEKGYTPASDSNK